MIQWFKKLFEVKPKYESVHTLYTELPYHIQKVSELYPICDTLVGNKADGEIRLFSIEDNKLRVGQALLLRKDKEVWIHLGYNYFKNIVKIK